MGWMCVKRRMGAWLHGMWTRNDEGKEEVVGQVLVVERAHLRNNYLREERKRIDTMCLRLVKVVISE